MDYDWDVARTTTDKLAEELNDIVWEIHQIQYVGGRDWVIISRQQVVEPDLSQPFKGIARRTVGGTQWEITIPSIGPDDDYLTAYAPNAAAVHPAARKALADALGVAFDEVQVDIDVDTRPR